MVKGAVISTPGSALPYAVVVRSSRAIIRSEPAHSMHEADRLLQRLLADVQADMSFQPASRRTRRAS
jgi:hypothetical protein